MILPVRSILRWGLFPGVVLGITRILRSDPISVATNSNSMQNSVYKFIAEAIFLRFGPVANTPKKNLKLE